MKKINQQFRKFLLFFLSLNITLSLVYGQQLDVDFDFTPNIPVCSGQKIDFYITINGSSSFDPNDYIYDWDFGGQGSSTEVSPSFSFEAFGCSTKDFEVELIVIENATLFSDSQINTVSVLERPNPEVINAATGDTEFNNCPNANTGNPEFTIEIINKTDFFNSCIASAQIYWGTDNNDNEPLPPYNDTASFTYQSLGEFYLTITATGTNGCNGETKYLIKNDINYPKGNWARDDSYDWKDSCAPITYVFKLGGEYEENSSTTLYRFDFDDGTYVDTLSQEQVEIDSAGVIRHTYYTSSCAKPDEIFEPKLTIMNSCENDEINGISTRRVYSAPTAILELDTLYGCDGDSICFSELSLPGYGWNCNVGDDFRWVFGNNDTSYLRYPPCQFYPGADTYYGSLKVSNYCGESVVNFVVQIDPPPVAVAVADTLTSCVPYEIAFLNSSFGGDLSFEWSLIPTNGWQFIVNDTLNPPDTTIQFTEKGQYIVSLHATNACNTDEVNTEITIMDKPEINLNIPVWCATETLNFDENLVEYDSSYSEILEYDWTFNGADPITSDEEFPTGINYNSTGIYTIEVRARNVCGWSDLFIQPVSVVNAPEITDFLYIDAEVVPNDTIIVNQDTLFCESDEIIRLAAVISDDTLFLLEGWYSTPALIQPNGTFNLSQPGNYNIQLDYSVTQNCSATHNINIQIVESPLVDAGDDIALCEGNTALQLLKGSEYPDGVWIISPPDALLVNIGIDWYFDPSLAGSLNYVLTYQYTDPDTDCAGSDDIEVSIDAEPNSEFTYSPDDPVVCVPIEITFDPPNNPNGTKYYWSINGNQENQVEVFKPILSDAGTYDIHLRVVSPNDSCSSFFSQVITALEPPPQPDFSIDTVCGDDDLNINVLTSSGDFSGTSNWYLDDEPTPFSSSFNPGSYAITPEQYPQIHTIRWELENDCGLKSGSKSVWGLPVPESIIEIDSSEIHAREITFVNKSENSLACEWIVYKNDSPIGDKISGCFDLTFDIEQAEKYTIKLVTNSMGMSSNKKCTDTATVTFEKIYRSLYIPNAFLPESPPQDSANMFKAVGIGLKSYNLSVYDTWGNLIWETSVLDNGRPAEGWDGKDRNGNDLPQDIYIWYARGVFIDNTIWQGMDGKTSGSVTLLR